MLQVLILQLHQLLGCLVDRHPDFHYLLKDLEKSCRLDLHPLQQLQSLDRVQVHLRLCQFSLTLRFLRYVKDHLVREEYLQKHRT